MELDGIINMIDSKIEGLKVHKEDALERFQDCPLYEVEQRSNFALDIAELSLHIQNLNEIRERLTDYRVNQDVINDENYKLTKFLHVLFDDKEWVKDVLIKKMGIESVHNTLRTMGISTVEYTPVGYEKNINE